MSRTIPALMLASAAALLLLHPLPAQAQGEEAPAEVPGRTINLLVYGEDACPEAQSEDEIVVCARQPESERYRVPRRFRDRGDRPLEVSWGARAADLEEAQRFTRPNGCSVDGSFGQTGCTQAMIRLWYAERREMARERERER